MPGQLTTPVANASKTYLYFLVNYHPYPDVEQLRCCISLFTALICGVLSAVTVTVARFGSQ
jgi:hypothetical protein